MPLLIGQVLNNRYRIVKLLGQGGFGAVYRAWDLNLKRPFALKENLDLSLESVRQFEREASFLANLHHPNLPRVIDYFLIQEQGQYLVMDFIEGETLEEKLDHLGGPLSPTQVIPWIVQVCDALNFLHTQKPPVIHRDVKPANIKVTPEGKAVLVDFGIAKAYFGQMQTTIGARAVTAGYSPPEQYGYGITDRRSDIYALGATLYHALTGQVPIESVQRHFGSDLFQPRSLNSDISPQVESTILKAMAVDVDQRYQNIQDFKRALESPVNVLQPVGGEVEVYHTKGTIAIDDKPISSPRRIPADQAIPQPAKKSTRGVIFKIGMVLAVASCLVLVSLAGLWTYFTYLTETGTPTPSRTLSISTDIPTATIVPTLVPMATHTPEPTHPPPTWTMTWTLTPTRPPATPTDTPTKEQGDWNPCPNTYASRLHVGDLAYVSYYPPLKNNVRSDSNLSASVVGTLEPGEEMKIIDGPRCANNMVWWKISSLDKNLVGWTSEGDVENYWLVPLP